MNTSAQQCVIERKSPLPTGIRADVFLQSGRRLMNFFNDKELARRFREGHVSSREQLIYFLIFLCATSILMSDFLIDPNILERLNRWDFYGEIGCFVLGIIGTVVCYRVNTVRDDREFIERYICIGFPVFVQTIVAGFVAFVGVYAVGEVFIDVKFHASSVGADFVITVFMIAYFYARLAESFKIAGGDVQPDAPAGVKAAAS